MPRKHVVEWFIIVTCVGLTLALAISGSTGGEENATARDRAPGHAALGPDNPKIRIDGDKTYVWAGRHPETDQDEWFDFTGAPMDPHDLQFGIGKDRIRAIDDPLFVKPDDPRLVQMAGSPYRPEERPDVADDLMVIGYADGSDARAYPLALLNRHELVNDRLNGKPVTVGW